MQQQEKNETQNSSTQEPMISTNGMIRQLVNIFTIPTLLKMGKIGLARQGLINSIGTRTQVVVSSIASHYLSELITAKVKNSLSQSIISIKDFLHDIYSSLIFVEKFMYWDFNSFLEGITNTIIDVKNFTVDSIVSVFNWSTQTAMLPFKYAINKTIAIKDFAVDSIVSVFNWGIETAMFPFKYAINKVIDIKDHTLDSISSVLNPGIEAVRVWFEEFFLQEAEWEIDWELDWEIDWGELFNATGIKEFIIDPMISFKNSVISTALLPFKYTVDTANSLFRSTLDSLFSLPTTLFVVDKTVGYYFRLNRNIQKTNDFFQWAKNTVVNPTLRVLANDYIEPGAKGMTKGIFRNILVGTKIGLKASFGLVAGSVMGKAVDYTSGKLINLGFDGINTYVEINDSVLNEELVPPIAEIAVFGVDNKADFNNNDTQKDYDEINQLESLLSIQKDIIL